MHIARAQVAPSAVAAHTLNLLSTQTGVDLFELMLEARDPKHQAEAKRKFIKALNSLKPGIYKYLREIPYTEEAFLEAYNTIDDDIKNGRYAAAKQEDQLVGAHN